MSSHHMFTVFVWLFVIEIKCLGFILCYLLCLYIMKFSFGGETAGLVSVIKPNKYVFVFQQANPFQKY